MTGFVDLHMHSTASDGLLSPSEVIEKAVGENVRLLALTDHDTMSGVSEALAKALELGVRLIPGVEISTRTHGKNCHLLAYFDSLETVRGFSQMLDERKEARERRFLEMMGKLHVIGVPLKENTVRRIANGAAIARPHVAQALREDGFVRELQEAFDLYLADGKPCYVPYEKVDTADIIGQVRMAGGVTSVAHPGNEGFQQKELADLKEAGLDAIEVYHFDHYPGQRDEYARIAGELGLLLTGGSDFHGHHNGRTFFRGNTHATGVPPEVAEPFLTRLLQASSQIGR